MSSLKPKAPRVLVMGLPGAGKTTLATTLAQLLNAVHFNADDIRANINKDLKFSAEDRIEQARRMGHLAEQVAKAGHFSVCDFVCPTPETRKAFIDAGESRVYVVFMDTIDAGRFADTNKVFVRPSVAIEKLEMLHTIAGWHDQLDKSAEEVAFRIKDYFLIPTGDE